MIKEIINRPRSESKKAPEGVDKKPWLSFKALAVIVSLMSPLSDASVSEASDNTGKRFTVESIFKQSPLDAEISKMLGEEHPSFDKKVELFKQSPDLVEMLLEYIKKDANMADRYASRISMGWIKSDFPKFSELVDSIVTHIPKNKRVTRTFMYALASGQISMKAEYAKKLQEVLQGQNFHKYRRLSRPIFKCIVDKTCPQEYRDLFQGKAQELLNNFDTNTTDMKYFMTYFLGKMPEQIPDYDTLLQKFNEAVEYIGKNKDIAQHFADALRMTPRIGVTVDTHNARKAPRYYVQSLHNSNAIGELLSWVGKDDKITETIIQLYVSGKIPDRFLTDEIKQKMTDFLKEKFKKDKQYAEDTLEAIAMGFVSKKDADILLPLIFEIYPDLKEFFEKKQKEHERDVPPGNDNLIPMS